MLDPHPLGVAAPLLEPVSHTAETIRLHSAGAIGLVVPSTQWPLDGAAINQLRTAARVISRQLGTPV